jgi:hypothetical protein
MDVAEAMILLGYPWGWRIRLERLWEDRVMSDRGDGEGTVLVQASKGAALAKLQRFLDKGELAQKRAVFLEALGEATDGDAHGIVMHAAG